MSGEIGQALKLSAIRKGKDPQFSSQSPSFFHHVVVLISVIGPHTATWSLLSSPDTQMQTNRPTLSYAAIIEMEKDYKLHKSKDQLKNERQNSYLINIPSFQLSFSQLTSFLAAADKTTAIVCVCLQPSEKMAEHLKLWSTCVFG